MAVKRSDYTPPTGGRFPDDAAAARLQALLTADKPLYDDSN